MSTGHEFNVLSAIDLSCFEFLDFVSSLKVTEIIVNLF